jgi:hypothetical protein
MTKVEMSKERSCYGFVKKKFFNFMRKVEVSEDRNHCDFVRRNFSSCGGSSIDQKGFERMIVPKPPFWKHRQS